MENERKKSNRGGKRAGAGRPKGTSRLFAFRAQKEVADFIDTHDNKTGFILDCIRSSMPEKEGLQALGDVIPAQSIHSTPLPYFEAKIVAGFPIPLDSLELAQHIDLLRMLCPHPEASFLIRVQGESMQDAGIHTGDILIVDKSNRTPSKHEVAVCELNGEYTVKYVHRQADGFLLVPANKEFPNLKVGKNDDFSIWGVVTYIIHKPRM